MVIRGEVAPGSNLKSALLDGETKHFDMERGFTRHPIDDKEDSCIVVKLGNPCIINHLRLLLWDKGKVVYGPNDVYRLEVLHFDQYMYLINTVLFDRTTGILILHRCIDG